MAGASNLPPPAAEAGQAPSPAAPAAGPPEGLRYKLATWYRKRRTPYDPRDLDPRVTFTGPRLGYHYMYHPLQVWAHRDADAEGFSVILRGGRWHRQPLTHCHMAMTRFHKFLDTGDEAEKAAFLRGADVLRRAAETRSLAGRTCDLWPYDFEIRDYVPHPLPWISCMVQSWALSVFCRAHQVTGQAAYLDAARRALAVYHVPVAEGGIRDTDAEGHVYYEEYPFPGRTHHVLNGFLSSLMGLWDFHRATGDAEARRLFLDAVATLTAEGVLARYDMGHCSAYDQHHGRRIKPAYTRYNLVHVRQLLVLYRITGEETLRRWSERWYGYSRSPWRRARCFLDAAVYRLRNLPRYVREAVGSRPATPAAPRRGPPS